MHLRKRISDLINAGNDNKTIIAVVKCHVSYVNKVLALKKVGGPVTPKKRPGRPAVLSAPRSLKQLRGQIEQHPRRSIREHARRFGFSEKTARRGCKKIGVVSRIRQRKPLLDERMRGLRVVRGGALLNNLKSAPSGKIVFFSDEKTFTVSEAYNRRNDRYLAIVDSDGDVDIEPGIRYATSTKSPSSVMFLGAVALTWEVSPSVWFKVGYRLTAVDYIDTRGVKRLWKLQNSIFDYLGSKIA